MDCSIPWSESPCLPRPVNHLSLCPSCAWFMVTIRSILVSRGLLWDIYLLHNGIFPMWSKWARKHCVRRFRQEKRCILWSTIQFSKGDFVKSNCHQVLLL
jgi:hypothetical protein